MRDEFRSTRLARPGSGPLLWSSFALCACTGGGSAPDTAPADTRTEIIYVIEDSLRDRSGRASSGTGSPAPARKAGEGEGEAADGPSLVTSVEVREESGEGVPFDPKGEYTVQVGTFADSTRAHERLRELRALGYPAYGLASEKGIRIRIGYFARRDQADRFGERFGREQGVPFWVDRRARESGSRR